MRERAASDAGMTGFSRTMRNILQQRKARRESIHSDITQVLPYVLNASEAATAVERSRFRYQILFSIV